jgi:hypothetical protein
MAKSTFCSGLNLNSSGVFSRWPEPERPPLPLPEKFFDSSCPSLKIQNHSGFVSIIPAGFLRPGSLIKLPYYRLLLPG